MADWDVVSTTPDTAAAPANDWSVVSQAPQTDDANGVSAGEHYLRSAIAPFAGGITYLGALGGTLAAGANLSDADAAAQSEKSSVESTVRGDNEPMTTTGKAIVDHINKVTDPYLKAAQKKFSDLADSAFEHGIPIAPGGVTVNPDGTITHNDITVGKGSPVTGAIAATAPQAAMLAAGGRAGGAAADATMEAAGKIMRGAGREAPEAAAAAAPAVEAPKEDADFSADDIKRLPGPSPQAVSSTAAPAAKSAQAASPAARELPPTSYQQDGAEHTVTSANGVTTADEQSNGNLKVTRSDTAPDAQGNGEGTARLVAMADQAHARGGYMTSDVSVSPGQAARYAALANQGYVVHQNPDATVNPATGNLVSDDPRKPVFTVGPKPLTGMPTATKVPGTGTVQFGPDPRIRATAEHYATSAGLPYNPPTDYVPIDPRRGAAVAQAYDAMQHTPGDPNVKAAYTALANETKAQWQAIEGTGLKVQFMQPGQADPYALSPRLALLDIKNNNHLWVYPTEGTGTVSEGGAQSAPPDHPLLQPSGVTVDGRPLLHNDLFRIVHDYFGHAKEGTGFRADGEFNAYRVHKAMYSPLAQQALATETLGQNAWVNFGPKAAANKGASGAATTYADQKAGLLPQHIIDDTGPYDPNRPAQATPTATAGAPTSPQNSRFKLPREEGASAGAVAPADQAKRLAVIQRSLAPFMPRREVRTTALTGDSKEAATDFQQAKLKGAAGDRMQQVIAGEQNAMREAVGSMARNPEFSETANKQRGREITDPVQFAMETFEKHDKQMYAQAKAVARRAPAAVDSFNMLVHGRRSEFIGSQEGTALLNGLLHRAQELGLQGANGTFNPATVEQIEELRQYASDQWSPRTSRLVARVKSALDDDATRILGTNVYARARANRALRSQFLEEPKGMQKLLPPEDRNEVNRPVALEDVPATLAGMPIEQFQHVFRALPAIARYFDSIGDVKAAETMRAKTAGAFNAMREYFAADAMRAGQKIEKGWDQKSFAQTLRDNEERMALVSKPGEMQRWQDINDAGNALKMDRSYPGAFVQQQNLGNRMREKLGSGVAAGVTGLAAHVGGPGLAFVSEMTGAGEKAGNLIKPDIEKQQLAAVERRITNLDQPAPGGGPRGGKFETVKPTAKAPLSSKLPGQRGGPKFTAAKVSDAQAIQQYLSDDEKAALGEKSLQKVLDTFHSLPPTHELAAAALAGKAKRGWYRDAAQAISNVFGGDAPRFTALLAAMSPQTSVEMNFHNALRSFVAWDKAGRPEDRDQIVKIMEQNSLRNPDSKSKSNVLDAWKNNAVRALTAKDPESLQLSGPKVDSFNQNLRENVNAVTLDSWMAAFAKMDPTQLGGTKRLAPNDALQGALKGKNSTYVGYSAKVREAAAMLTHMTGEKWTPAEVQETVWSFAKAASEHANTYGGMATIPELVKSGELTDELIKGTSDFHNLFEEPGHAAALGASNFAGGLEKLRSAKGNSAERGSASEAEAAAAKALRPHLVRAAKRLDVVRQDKLAKKNGSGEGVDPDDIPF